MKDTNPKQINTLVFSNILLAQIKRGFYISTQKEKDDKKKGSTD
jgi:hypothetical protein